IIRLRRVPFMDITGIQVLEEVMRKLRLRGIRVMLCEANERVRAKLERAGVISDGAADDYVDHLIEAIKKVTPSS
ncbi:MAG: STAS domain-containing protein, partial [Burkholderiaceae bacterium]